MKYNSKRINPKLLFLRRAVRKSKDNGYYHMLEFGVYKGKTLRCIREWTESCYRVFGFDSFQGLPEAWIDVYGNQVGNGAKHHFAVDAIPKIRRVTMFPGWFQDTVSQYAEKHKDPISFLHLDCDLYSSTKEVLWGLNDYIRKGTIILYDDWIYNRDKDENDSIHQQKAHNEWVKEFVRSGECIFSHKKYHWSKMIFKVTE